ncbi:MAG: hypothetical protein QM586_05900 [Xenophilus sp.]
MQVLTRSGEEWNHVEFTLDDNFAERLRQLRTLVPPLSNLNRNRDLVIDKVRVRLPSAIWRCGGPGEAASEVDGSSIVIAGEGFFNCGGRKRSTRENLVTYTFPIARLIELHVARPGGEAFFLRNGLFTNDEPAHSSAGRWVASLHVPEQAGGPGTDFDTMPGSPVPLAHPRRAEGEPAQVRALN